MTSRISYLTLLLVSMVALPYGVQASASNVERNAYYGDLHLITGNAFTGFPLSCELKPDDAYRFARGEPISVQSGNVSRRSAPLDFLAVTDFAEYLGLFNTLYYPNSPFSNTEIGKQLRDPDTRLATFGKFLDIAFYHRGKDVEWLGLDPQVVKSEMASTWREEIEAANRNYIPGRFTTFIGYHWTSKVDGTQDRVVLFRGSKAPLPFTSFDSLRPEDLWTYLEKNRGRGIDALAIPHNANISNGLMFNGLNSEGKPIDRAYARRRSANEPVVEISNNGQSETLPKLSPEDPFSNFEMFGNENMSDPRGSYVRDGLGRGLEIAQRIGVDPYDVGFVGGSDFHNGMSDSAENATDSIPDVVDPTAKLTEDALIEQARDSHPYASGSLTGVWAERNTRESIFDAIRRKETFATSGTRLKLRLFGGWHYSKQLYETRNWVSTAYSHGVPMGSGLPIRPDNRSAPTFAAWATKDPMGGNLDRMQIVKIWIDNGHYVEKVFDVALSGGRKVAPGMEQTPTVGNTVNVSDATYSNTIGAPALAVVWTDPEFSPASSAVYYLRVLEIPTPRWSTLAAAKAHIPLVAGVSPTIQERGWSSPIRYTPSLK